MIHYTCIVKEITIIIKCIQGNYNSLNLKFHYAWKSHNNVLYKESLYLLLQSISYGKLTGNVLKMLYHLSEQQVKEMV